MEPDKTFDLAEQVLAIYKQMPECNLKKHLRKWLDMPSVKEYLEVRESKQPSNSISDEKIKTMALAYKKECEVLGYSGDIAYDHYVVAAIRTRTQIESNTPQPVKFEMPTDNQLIKVAILFNDGKVDMAQLTNMVGMCQFVIDRLFENGNVMIPSLKEKI